MNKTNAIYIIGAGVSGLIAAQVLENKGYSPIIIEATDRAGGRVKTDVIKGYQLDHGFQVLLDAYPKAKEYLDYDRLNLQKLIPGAIIFKNENRKLLGDPRRDLSMTLPTLFSTAATFSDKLKVLKLNRELAKKDLESLFNEPEITTLEYLKNYGFSKKIIKNFFKPFFTGIFLEDKLETSSRMFQYVFKMFGKGFAVIPRDGIEAISRQLQENLVSTTFEFNTRVNQVTQDEIHLENGKVLNHQGVIIATDATTLVPNLRNQQTQWKSVENLYFEVRVAPVFNKPLIGLIASKNALINNIFYPTSISTEHTGQHVLLSVSVVKEHDLNEKELIAQVEYELKKHAGIHDTNFLQRYSIRKALPRLDQVKYNVDPGETQLSPTIFLAGDQQLNGSLNAAMISGEQAALGLIQNLEGGIRY